MEPIDHSRATLGHAPPPLRWRDLWWFVLGMLTIYALAVCAAFVEAVAWLIRGGKED